ncbi:carbon starvation protein A [Uruburuella suis]|jgi:carbon starvation protein|uniref:Carbon starvation protein n=1 Tax=Uruburuella suis TaxID=252130 RepID=A0AAE9GTJ8_9NEIS|nr:carbon starvation CstA family protein [Uruburuella suis]MBP7257939.1 carbon starvation protein A [Neisseria sp.]MBP8070157.1 carbon starvation protein A [Neisseria sp.]TCP01941.1 carbon starvation protein [Uruburuella suis]UOO78739.1 carbon starvation protein A [Uruburuella suis]
MKHIKTFLLWGIVVLVGLAAFTTLAMSRGEQVSAVWMVVAAISVYCIAYRFYSLFIANQVMELDANRLTPAERHNDGLDYVPTHKGVLFGHHFAAIAGAGPLVGPVLAAQMGYLPGTLWIIFGVVFAGAVQDMMVLFISMRRDGRSLGDIVKQELGTTAGIIASVGILMIMVIIMAVLALIVVKALTHSPWGTFTIAATMPIALFMGIYTRYIRPGKIGEISIVGFILLMLAIVYGENVANSSYAHWFDLTGVQLTWAIMIYGFVAAVLPVWLLLTPRDYLSTFLKIGTIIGLAIGIIVVSPALEMPAVTKFIDGTGPVFSGSLFPFLFITIACGAVSGFHALISSGTTPKMIENETHVRMIGYGGMLMESFVAIMALAAASVLDPGIYFAMNSPTALIGTDAVQAAQVVTQMGFPIDAATLLHTADAVGENTILSRAGGAPTLAVGMAHIMSQLIPGEAMMAFWYHFALLFEALFILTAVDAGTRVARFMIQDLGGIFIKPFGNTDSLPANLTATFLAVALWGYFLYTGVTDPLGGINSLWPLFGIGNQMLAGVALIMVSVILVKMKKERYVWVPLVPAVLVLFVTCYASLQKLFHTNPKIGFLAHAAKFKDAAARGEILAPAKDVAQMHQIAFNDYVNSGLTVLFLSVVVIVGVYGLRVALKARKVAWPTAKEVPAVYRNEVKANEP